MAYGVAMMEVPPKTAPYEFLVALDEALRPLLSAAEITGVAARLVSQSMTVSRCAYAKVAPDQNTFDITCDYSDGVPSLVGHHRLSEFGAEFLRLARAAQPFVVEDVETDPRTQVEIDSYRRAHIRAAIAVPLLAGGRLCAVMAVHHNQPRRWRQEEVELLQLVASRCWEAIERARVSRELQEANERLKLELRELSSTERQFAQLVAGVTDCAIYMIDRNGYVTSWNPGAERIKGYTADEIIGRHFSQFYTVEDRAIGLPARSLSLVATQGKFEGEGWRMRKDGSRFWASVLIDPIYSSDRQQVVGYAKITRDMTERRLMQEQLNQAQKMEAIGQLTGGVAHDFNNLLTVILGNLDIVQRRSPADDERLQRAIEHATRGAERAAGLTHQLLAFARRQPLNPKPTSVNQLVTTLLELIRRTLPEAITVQSRLSAGVGQVSVDPNQMESALLNLAVNARDAMSGKGTLTISTELMNVSEDDALRLGDLLTGPHAVISVADTGVGMSPEVIERAFDPFFTTKPIGQGTGLGLSQVFGFVKQSGGTVKLLSELGEGTTVKIFLPSAAASATSRHERGREEAPQGHFEETVLVVEDEDDVRAYSIECLQDLGFSVLHSCDGPSALRLIADHPEIRLLFTDVGLPHMSGRELAQEVRRIRPELPVLFTTGYAQDGMFQQGKLEHNAELLTKPFNRTQLAERVRHLLDA